MSKRVTVEQLVAGVYDSVSPEGDWQACLTDYVQAVGGHSGTIVWRQGHRPLVELATSGF
jgi:hypothetical protein